MEEQLVSIVTPMYNGAKYVALTIESVLAQTYPHWEMLIVNDGSKDNGPEIVQEYVAKDSRIRLIHQPNGGSASARNNGIRQAQGRYLCLLDSDDVWEPYFLESQLALLKQKQCLLVYGSHKRINEAGEECLKPFHAPQKETYQKLLLANSISCLTAMYDSSAHGKFYLNESLRSVRDDYAFWLSILKKVGVAYGNPIILGSYRVMANSTTGNKKKLIKPHFLFLYRVEKLGLIRSIFYTCTWALSGIIKYIILK